MKPCDNLRLHFSALLDGELEPLESIGVRRHIEHCSKCAEEYEALEQLKLEVHVAGTEAVMPDAVRQRLAAAVASQVGARQARRAWRMPLAAAAVIVLGLGLTSFPGDEIRPDAAIVAAAERAVTVDGATLERLVAVHHAEARPRDLDDLVRAGALMAFEQLPGSFIGPEGGRAAVVQATYADCDAGATGTSLAVLRASRVDLPVAVASALETNGVFVDVVRGTEVRLTVGGDKLFVLLTELEPAATGTSISMELVLDPAPEALEAAFALRYRVFCEEQQVPLELERDGLDGQARHAVLLDGERAVATGRLMIKGEVAKMQRVAVDATRRGQGLGREIMDALEALGRGAGAGVARLASQVDAVPFYERLGYRAHGERFMDAGIPHRWMDKPLS